jgi:hypothetical protein
MIKSFVTPTPLHIIQTHNQRYGITAALPLEPVRIAVN